MCGIVCWPLYQPKSFYLTIYHQTTPYTTIYHRTTPYTTIYHQTTPYTIIYHLTTPYTSIYHLTTPYNSIYHHHTLWLLSKVWTGNMQILRGSDSHCSTKPGPSPAVACDHYNPLRCHLRFLSKQQANFFFLLCLVHFDFDLFFCWRKKATSTQNYTSWCGSTNINVVAELSMRKIWASWEQWSTEMGNTTRESTGLKMGWIGVRDWQDELLYPSLGEIHFNNWVKTHYSFIIILLNW